MTPDPTQAAPPEAATQPVIPDGEYKVSETAPVGLMQQVSQTIAYFQNILDRFGDSCVYVRPGGVSWGSVALNRRSEDEKLGTPGSDLDRVTRQLHSLSVAHETQSQGMIERLTRITDLQGKLSAAEAELSLSRTALAAREQEILFSEQEHKEHIAELTERIKQLQSVTAKKG